jgi:hypothetical protein
MLLPCVRLVGPLIMPNVGISMVAVEKKDV